MILAIDQSYSGTGVAYIASDGRIQADCIKTPSGIPWEARWDAIFQALNSYFDGSAIKLEKPRRRNVKLRPDPISTSVSLLVNRLASMNQPNQVSRLLSRL